MSKYTREEILEMPVSGGAKNLRKVASELGLEEVQQGGVLVPIQSARKPALQLEILEIVGTEVEEQPTLEDLDGLAAKYWQLVKDYAIGLWRVDPETQEYGYSKVDGGLLSIARVFVNEIAYRPSKQSDSGTIAATTIKNFKSSVKGLCQRLMDADPDPRLQPHKDHVEYIFNELWGYKKELDNGERKYVRGIIDQNIADYTSIKKKGEAKSLLERKHNPSHVYVSDLYKWAMEVLSSDLVPRGYREISIALMVVTGRRPAEIHATAKFDLSDKPDWVWFSGQLKTKGRSDAEPTYEIPVFSPPALIVAALEHLDKLNKRVPESYADGNETERAKKANDTWSSELNQKCKDIDTKITYKIRGERLNPKTKVIEPQRLTCNGCRDIYAQVSTLLYLEPQDRLLQMGKFLGHRLGDSAVTEKYNLDYQVLDTEDELRAVINFNFN